MSSSNTTQSRPRTVCCIGDVHGHNTKLQNLWKNLETHIGPSDFISALIIFLGDYCDRGPNTREVIDFLISPPTKYPNQNMFSCWEITNWRLLLLSVSCRSPVAVWSLKKGGKIMSRMKREKGEKVHLRGRMWGGKITDEFNATMGNECKGSIYDAAPTFESYGVAHGSADLVKAVPDNHKKFLADTVWVHEEDDVCVETGDGIKQWMGSYFSLSQWQELELQALIYRYMLAGTAVPPELLQSIKKSLLNTSPYFLHLPLHNYSHYQPALLQSGYWGRGQMDPESGRCRRTDGKKWRCSRDVVAGHKYCERHMHRGRARSRKHVEIPTPTSAVGTLKNTSTTINAAAAPPLAQMANAANFALSTHLPSFDLLQFDQRTVNKGLFEPQNEVGNRSDGHILRHFFDDWPRSLQDHNNAKSNASTVNSATSLSISMPGNSSSDVSLKLSTGNGDQPGSGVGDREEPQLNWATGWATNAVAEALRSSTSHSNSSPTSVLHQLPRSSASEASYVST